jgi:hypothetical protein
MQVHWGQQPVVVWPQVTAHPVLNRSLLVTCVCKKQFSEPGSNVVQKRSGSVLVRGDYATVATVGMVCMLQCTSDYGLCSMSNLLQSWIQTPA